MGHNSKSNIVKKGFKVTQLSSIIIGEFHGLINILFVTLLFLFVKYFICNQNFNNFFIIHSFQEHFYHLISSKVQRMILVQN